MVLLDENLEMLYPKRRTNSKYPTLLFTMFCGTCVIILIIDVLKANDAGLDKYSLKGDFNYRAL